MPRKIKTGVDEILSAISAAKTQEYEAVPFWDPRNKEYRWTHKWRDKGKQVPKTYNSPYARKKRAEEEEKNRLTWERLRRDNVLQEEIDRHNRSEGHSYQGDYTEGWRIDKRSPDPERYTKPDMEFGIDGDFSDRTLWNEKLKHAMEKSQMIDQYRKLKILSMFNKNPI
jgi:hypothetical protein